MGLQKYKENIEIIIIERDNYKYALVNICIRDNYNNLIREIELIVPSIIIKSIEEKMIIKDTYNDINSFAKDILNKKFSGLAKSLINIHKPLSINEIKEAVRKLKNFL